MNKPTREIMTVLEVSAFLRIPPSTIYDLAKRGQIKGVKIGKHWRFLAEDIEKYFHGVAKVNKTRNDKADERRNFPRINTNEEAYLIRSLPQTEDLPCAATLRNLSEGGAYLMMKEPGNVRVGDPVQCVFPMPPLGKELKIEGRVVHCENKSQFTVGLKFKNVPKETQELIRAYVG